MIYNIILKIIIVFFFIYILKFGVLFIIFFKTTKLEWLLLRLLRRNINYDPIKKNTVKNLTRNFYLTYPNKETIGIWHSLPNTTSDELRKRKTKISSNDFEAALSTNTNQKVFIYCHGILGYRGNKKSSQLMNFIGDRDAHTFVIDYRGFGDTIGEFSEYKCYEDVKTVYKHISKFAPSRVSLWGHGMGAAIAAKVAAELSEEETPPTQLILEAPFTNFVDAVLELPFFGPSRIFGYYIKKFVHNFPEIVNKMAIDKIFPKIGCHIILLHSKDDSIYPYYMSQQLYLLARENDMTCHLYLFDESFGLGHFNIINTPDIKTIYDTCCDAQ
uniref:Hydrolase_4 domain-containing protein n=1 Tax=Strongyloides stercoralis TaxID=6248 RepID=A0A0K0DTK2_STRER